jgi:hypothetical protein
MGILFVTQVEYGKALEWYQLALDGYEKTFGKDYLPTLSTVHSMGSVFDDHGEYGMDLSGISEPSMAVRKLGNDPPCTFDPVHNMGKSFRKARGV